MNAGQAETYLRLRAEAELRRALTLPRVDPPDAGGMPGPLRAAVRLARPGTALIASAAQPALPLARRAADALRPLAGESARALQPVADEATRALRPLADEAARRLQPLSEQAARRLRPFAADAAHRLEPLGWRAVDAIQTLGAETAEAIMSVRRQATRVIRSRPGASPGSAAGHRKLSADEGVHRLRAVAGALVQAGAIDSGTADSVLAGLETALLARSRMDPHWRWRRDMMAMHRRQPARAPAGLYRAAPVGVTIPAAPDSGLGGTRLLTLVIAPDRAGLTAAGHGPELLGQESHRDRWAALHDSRGFWPSATDDRGNSYELNLGSWSSEGDGDWSGTLDISPVPAAGIRWLALTVSPGLAPTRVDITGVTGESEGAAGPIPADSPADRLFDAAAESLLYHAAIDGDSVRRHDLSRIADIATALAACGALPPACAAIDRLVALARRLGVDVPAALSASAQPAELPDAWTSVLENGQRLDGRSGVAAVAAVLPELDGARFVLAGLRSAAAGAELQVQGWGNQLDLHPFGRDMDEPWSWWARDDAGRWHILRADGGSYGGGYSEVQMRLFPPLHPEATSLEITLTGVSGRVTATVPLNWLEPA